MLRLVKVCQLCQDICRGGLVAAIRSRHTYIAGLQCMHGLTFLGAPTTIKQVQSACICSVRKSTVHLRLPTTQLHLLQKQMLAFQTPLLRSGTLLTNIQHASPPCIASMFIEQHRHSSELVLSQTLAWPASQSSLKALNPPGFQCGHSITIL